MKSNVVPTLAVLTIAIALPFGFWQHNIFAGLFMGVVALCFLIFFEIISTKP